jgi:hypothetical protein
MGAKIKLGAAVVAMSLAMVDQAFAHLFPLLPPPAVPEIDASNGVAAIALLASIAAVCFSRFRSKE